MLVSVICAIPLLAMKSIRNLLAPPVIIITDHLEFVFNFPTRFRIKVSAKLSVCLIYDTQINILCTYYVVYISEEKFFNQMITYEWMMLALWSCILLLCMTCTIQNIAVDGPNFGTERNWRKNGRSVLFLVTFFDYIFGKIWAKISTKVNMELKVH
jgi:hypothetical protein